MSGAEQMVAQWTHSKTYDSTMLEQVFKHGKYRGCTLMDVAKADPNYLGWCSNLTVWVVIPRYINVNGILEPLS